jgi:epoxyqueuosine reductase
MSAKLKKITAEIKTFTLSKGADLVGIADLKLASDFIANHGEPIAAEFPRAISIGMQINDTIVETHDPNEPRGKSLYWHHIYDVVSVQLNHLAFDVSRWLAGQGYETLPIPASMPYNLKKLQGVISHKLPAHLSGLGWIGKNCLLLSKEFGPRVRFATVLTDAPLAEDKATDKKCGKCTACIDACPVSAFTNTEFSPDEDVHVRFNTAKCSEYRSNHPCGLCVSSCPLGGNAKKRRKKQLD